MISRRSYGFETLKITGLESKPYAVRERVAPVVGKEPLVWWRARAEEPGIGISAGAPLCLQNWNQILKELKNISSFHGDSGQS